MGARIVRINELVRQEISNVLHTLYKTEAVNITISEVAVAPDLRSARVYYSVLGKESTVDYARQFFARENEHIRRAIGRRIVLKYLPHLEFITDDSLERGARLNALLDELGLEGEIDTNNASKQF